MLSVFVSSRRNCITIHPFLSDDSHRPCRENVHCLGNGRSLTIATVEPMVTCRRSFILYQSLFSLTSYLPSRTTNTTLRNRTVWITMLEPNGANESFSIRITRTFDLKERFQLLGRAATFPCVFIVACTGVGKNIRRDLERFFALLRSCCTPFVEC